MKHLFSILLFLSVIGFANVNAENKGSPAGIENYVSQENISCFEVPAFANIEAISVGEVPAFDSGICADLICPVINYATPAQTFIDVDSGQGYKRCQPLSNYAINDLQRITLSPIALSGGQGLRYRNA